jgi:transposase
VFFSSLLEPRRRADGRGQPWRDAREGLNGILWIPRSDARWQDLPERFPRWAREGTRRQGLEVLAADLRGAWGACSQRMFH